MPSQSHGVDPPAEEAPAPSGGARDKVRLTFRKGGPLRWLSHHDLLRAFERMLHRSSLPFRRSQGFNPHPRLVFALSLPLGVVGRAEVVELELDERLSPDEVRDRLARQAPAGLDILDACRIPPRASARVTGLCYGLTVPEPLRAETRRRLDARLLGGECWVERTRPAPRRVDIGPFVREIAFADETGWLEMHLRLTPQGTARPEEVLSLVGLGGLLAGGAILERLGLDLAPEGSSCGGADAPRPRPIHAKPPFEEKGS